MFEILVGGIDSKISVQLCQAEKKIGLNHPPAGTFRSLLGKVGVVQKYLLLVKKTEN